MLRLRSGPQDLPPSWTLAAVVIGIYIAEILLTAQHLGGKDDVGRSLFSTAFQFAAVAALLTFRGHPERLAQTLLAFAGTGVLLGLLAFVFLIQADPDVNQPVLALAWFAIFGWSLAVDAHIFRHALSVSLSIGMLITVVILALSYVIVENLFR